MCSYLWHIWGKQIHFITVQLLYQLLMAAGAKRAACWQQQDLETEALRSMWSQWEFFFSLTWVFPCSLILPLSGVSAQVSFQLIGLDWDGRKSWSVLTRGTMIYVFSGLCRKLNVFEQVCKHTQVFVGSCWDQKVNSILGVRKVPHLSCYSKPPACKVFEYFSEYYSAKQLIRH